MRQTVTNAIKFFFHHQDTPWCLGALVVKAFVVASFLGFGTPALSADLAALEGINRLLQAEYQLAKKDQLYLIFDLAARQVQIKASGVVLVSLPIETVQRQGRQSQEALRTLRARKAFSSPQRIAIGPQAEQKTGKFELQALEIDDMPKTYRLLLDDGSALTITPLAEGLWGRITATARGLWWRLSRPLISGWYSLRRKPYTEVRLTLAAHDARRLYWSFQEGMPCLIAWRIP